VYTETCHVGFMVYRQITVTSLTPIRNFKPKNYIIQKISTSNQTETTFI